MYLVKPIEIIKGSSLSTVVGSTSRFVLLQIDKPSLSSHDEENFPLNIFTSTEAVYQPTLTVSHRRSNTVPSRQRKPDLTKISNQKTTHLSPTYQRNDNNQQQSSSSRPFSASSLKTHPKQRRRIIDDTDDGKSPSTSIVNQEK